MTIQKESDKSDEMTIITEIKTITVNKSRWDLKKLENPYSQFEARNELNEYVPTSVNEISELIQGRKHTRPDGSQLILGYPKEIADTIGIEYEAWENMERSIERMLELQIKSAKVIKHQNKALDSIAEAKNLHDIAVSEFVLNIINATFIQRLKYLFRF